MSQSDFPLEALVLKLEYKFANVEISMENVFIWLRGMFNINTLNGCNLILDKIVGYEFEKYLY